ncbi:hypothetical protein CN514_07620 [Bacillus sp. AFS001701]|uniref:hypothetical protein n=1 Tax=Bacillus sp. AFS001701 TaxID=2033480 RepID=UPI000BF64352|nr:hypothetical protein [Bacillus sp. AFS001701]PET71257.1 hypothetical protein CN514_07620 [Bacillus sp. AFS001701]
MSDENTILTAKEYADLKGKDNSWGTRLAKRASELGYSSPKKMGNYWVGTYSDWETVLTKSGIQLRNREKKNKD